MDGGIEMEISKKNKPKFKLGQIVATPAVLEKVPKIEIEFCLTRHAQGNWGYLSEEDREANEEAVKDGDKILSAYRSSAGIRFWIITEADRSVTTILLPGDY
jgi:hypothetical protein